MENFFGRVFSIDSNIVEVFDGTRSFVKFDFSKCDKNFKCGDILLITFVKKDENKMVDTYKVLTSCVSNPFENNKTLPSRFLNENLTSQLVKRQQFEDLFREFFENLKYTEVKSPILVDSPGVETYLEPFATTYYDYQNKPTRLYLPTSPEYGLKAYVGATLSSVYSFARSFRNSGEESVRHKKEFTMLEWYIVMQNYKYIIDQIEQMLKYVVTKFVGSTQISYRNQICDFSKCNKFSMKELFARFDINLDEYTSDSKHFVEQIKNFYQDKNIVLSDEMNNDDYFFKFFMDNIEPTLGYDHPTVVYDYPIQMCPLSVPSEENQNYGQRFEAYIFGIEVANGYTELTDYQKQATNFEIVLKERKKLGEVESVGMPQFFLDSLKMGIPPCTGCALGFDRVFMIVQDLADVHQTNWY